MAQSIRDHAGLVSIGIPTYNRPQGLRRTLSCLSKQTYTNLEIIVSDNCSPSNETEQVVAKAAEIDKRIRYVRQDQAISIWDNFRFVLRQASGRYFMWAADDDEWSPDFVVLCLDAMDGQSSSAMSAFDTHYRQSGIRKLANMPALSNKLSTSDNLLAFLRCLTPSFFYGLHRREAIEFCLHDDIFDYYDCYFVLRLIASGGISITPELLYTAGVDAQEYQPKPMGISWGSGLRVLPFYRATRKLFGEVPLVMADRAKLEVMLAMLAIRLTVVNEGRAILANCRNP